MVGVFLRGPVLKEELSRGSPAPGSEISVPVLESGSSGEREREEKHLEKVLSLQQAELAETKLQL